ncbi:NUDIX domain-containing protein [Aureimonas flava]|uniref:NUDIX domain-containing protein n=1 Tax=Aureimonas flava TaxID=2320271 RepID=A0A3A1WNE8_9HYPH|nr:NUDIX domain-containing protein [Aureimonas flava]RIY02104.1 NUDIX domain-containing protein [Aureimonas flava]
MSAREPRLGTGAAILRGGRLLLIRRRGAPEAGAWGLPGGKVDLFERANVAAAREVLEETGLRIVARELLCVVDQIDRDAGDHWFAPVYVVEDAAGEPAITEPHKHDGLDWFALDALPEPLTAPTRGALPHLRERLNRRSAGGAS